MDTRYARQVGEVVRMLVNTGAHRATKYLSAGHVVRATHKLVRGKVPSAKKNIELVVTLGRPNFAERRFIRQCARAGEPFPVRKVQIKQPPKRKG